MLTVALKAWYGTHTRHEAALPGIDIFVPKQMNFFGSVASDRAAREGEECGEHIRLRAPATLFRARRRPQEERADAGACNPFS